MSSTILYTIKTNWESNSTFEKASELANSTKKKVDQLNISYTVQKEKVGQLKDKVDDLGNSAETCHKKAKGIFGAVFGANIATKALGMAKDAIVGFTKDSMEAYEKHNVALTQLEQVMKNTMGAGKWGVQDIVNVTKAQEKLGVVSSTTQLAGAKELGTYLKKKESLEKLLPVMNDMLAHQNGINATQENAQSIAQMMGKVLDGQTGALSRAGYSFDEAQKKILETGNEYERVAVLAEVVTQYVGGVNEALAATPEGKAKQVAMEYDEMKIRVGEVATKLKGDAMMSLQKFTLALYDNRKVIAGVAKVVTSAAVAWGGYKTAVMVAANWTKITTALTAAKTFVVKLFTGQLNLATRAMHAFNTASKANIIGAITGALLAAAAAFAMFRKRGKEATDEMKSAKEAFSSFYAQERTQLDTIFAKLRQTNPKSKERNELVDELKRMYPDLNKQLEDEVRNTNNLSNAYDVLIGKIIQRAKTKAQEEYITEMYKSPVVGNFEDIIDKVVAEDMAKPLIVGFKNGVAVTQKKGKAYEEGLRKKTREHYMTGDIFSMPKEQRIVVDRYRNLDRKINALAGRISFGLDTYIGSGLDGGSGGTGGGGSTSTASDAITGGGRQVKNFYITIENLIGENTNMFQSSNDNPASAQSFMTMMSDALQRVVNDVNYAAN